MTKLFILSDIHGSTHFLKRALSLFERENAEYLVLLGDLLYHGARNPLPEEYSPKNVTEMLNAYADRIIAVRGNCDSEVDQMVLQFPMMADYSNLLVDGHRFFLSHGHLDPMDQLPFLGKDGIYVFGHTHLPMAQKKKDVILFNPGSITMPKENNPNTYGIYQNDLLCIKDLSGMVIDQIELPGI